MVSVWGIDLLTTREKEVAALVSVLCCHAFEGALSCVPMKLVPLVHRIAIPLSTSARRIGLVVAISPQWNLSFPGRRRVWCTD